MKLSQTDKILIYMLSEKEKEYWTAKDFQKSKYFIGYEATARMSDLMNLYPTLFIVGREDRFRTLAINWKKRKRMIKQLKKKYGIK